MNVLQFSRIAHITETAPAVPARLQGPADSLAPLYLPSHVASFYTTDCRGWACGRRSRPTRTSFAGVVVACVKFQLFDAIESSSVTVIFTELGNQHALYKL